MTEVAVKDGEPTTDAEAKKGKVSYLDDVAKDLSEESQLTSVPADYDYRLHENLKKADFANEAHFLTWKANVLEARAKEMMDKAGTLRKDAELFAKYGDPKKKAQIARAKKLASKFDELRKQLEAEGVNVDEILADG